MKKFVAVIAIAVAIVMSFCAFSREDDLTEKNLERKLSEALKDYASENSPEYEDFEVFIHYVDDDEIHIAAVTWDSDLGMYLTDSSVISMEDVEEFLEEY